jgi:hypothetical protein
MVRHLRVIACVLLPLCLSGVSVALTACGGGKKAVKDPSLKDDASKRPAPPPETEEDREKKRQAAAHQIVPEGSNCLPAALKGDSAPHLELASVHSEAIACAIDGERERLLGPVACWIVDLGTGELKYQKPAPLPGHGFAVKLDDRCARGYCLPKDAKVDAKIGHIVWSPEGTKVAVNVGDEIHLFDAASKARESSFSVRGDKGVSGDPIGLYWVGDSIFVVASDGAANSPVWSFKAADGASLGPLEGLGKGSKPVSTHGGSFLVLEQDRVGVAEQGFSSVTTYEVSSGKRAKLVRKLPKTPCKPEEANAYWSDNLDKVPDKCKEFMKTSFAYLAGADAVEGTKSMIVLLRAPRLGEIALLDKSKSLAESKAIKMPWCPEGGDKGKEGGDKGKAEKAKADGDKGKAEKAKADKKADE